MEYAFHSPVLEPMLDLLEEEAAAISYHEPEIPVVSSLTGEFSTDGAMSSASYWRRQAREPVQFWRAFERLLSTGHNAFVEIGPTPTLLAIAQRNVEGGSNVWLPTLRKDHSDWEQIRWSVPVPHGRRQRGLVGFRSGLLPAPRRAADLRVSTGTILDPARAA